MCEYCLCAGNNHDYMCPNYSEPDHDYKTYECAKCGTPLYSDESRAYIVIGDERYCREHCGDIADVLIEKGIAYEE